MRPQVPTLQAIALTLARVTLPLWRAVRGRRDRHRGPLLGDDHAATVAMVWLDGLTCPERHLADHAGVLAIFDRVIVVTDDWSLARSAAFTGYRFELVPDMESRQRFRPDLDWQLWAERRRDSLRYAWAPDFEIDPAGSAERQDG